MTKRFCIVICSAAKVCSCTAGAGKVERVPRWGIVRVCLIPEYTSGKILSSVRMVFRILRGFRMFRQETGSRSEEPHTNFQGKDSR